MNQPATAWHLRGNWAPLQEELTSTKLTVHGNIPPELSGVYIRTGPNPKTGKSPHWFLGDGMVHGLRLEAGKACWYRNRFIQTADITDPLADASAGLGDLRRGKGNTHVVHHAGRILCLEEAHWPWVIDSELNTLGCENFNGALTSSMTAHPKVCPLTGELLAFSYFTFEPPYLKYIRIGADGQLKQLEGIDIPNMVMMHDFNITEHYVIFMDLPLALDLSLLSTGVPFSFQPNLGARLGVMPRDGSNADVRWFDIDPCYVFHPVNAYEQAGKIVIFVSRQPSAFSGSSDDYANVGRLWRWEIDLTTGQVSEDQVDDRPADFGRIDDRRVGLPSRYGYLMSLAGEGNSEEPVYGSKLYKYDLDSGACVEHDLRLDFPASTNQDVRGAEPVFVAAGEGEDEGWVMTLCHDEASGQSRFLILDAQHFDAPPVAMIELPQRIPYGAHGNWIPDAAVD